MEFRSAMPFCPPIWRPSKKIRARHASSSHLERCKWQKLLLSAKLSGFPNLDVHYACRPWNSCSSLKTGDKTRSLIASIFLRYGSSASLSLPRLLMDTLVKPRYSPLAIRQSPLSGIHWRPGFRHFPWIGGIAIVVIVFCVAGCVVIITLSDDQPVVSWNSNLLYGWPSFHQSLMFQSQPVSPKEYRLHGGEAHYMAPIWKIYTTYGALERETFALLGSGAKMSLRWRWLH
jgi:hypothetical protein